MSAHILISGAGGFVGSAIAEGFIDLGWRVTALDVAFDDPARMRLAHTALVSVDLAQPVAGDLPSADVFVHAAAITTDPHALGWSRSAHIAANTRPLLSMLDHAARTRPTAFVYLSSSGVFSARDANGALTDADTPSGQSPYAVAKRAGELITLAALIDSETTAHVVRLGNLYGPHEVSRSSRARVSLVAEWLAAAREGRPLMMRADDPARDWTFTRDLAPALARLVTGPSAGRPIHVGSSFALTDSALAALISHHFPAATCGTLPVTAPMKPPMAPSDVPALRGFAWTDTASGLATLVAAEVSA